MNKTKQSILGAGLLFLSFSTLASGPIPHVPEATAWERSDLRAQLSEMTGDPRRGQQVHGALMCASCHGETGLSPSRNYPHLAGQRAEYTYKQLLDYRDGRRHEGTGQAQIMYKLAQLLDERDMQDLAAFYAAQPLPEAKGPSVPAPELVREGDPDRLITGCASCHGLDGQGGRNETPALAGQEPHYFIRTMRAFREHVRTNDLDEGMAQFAALLSDEEIEALARYYANATP